MLANCMRHASVQTHTRIGNTHCARVRTVSVCVHVAFAVVVPPFQHAQRQ